jgi:inhibitor of cysteine peptidase
MTSRARAPLALVLAGLVAATLLVGCSGGDDSSGHGTGSSDAKVEVFHESDTSISVDTGQRFVLALPANPSTGYSWKAVVANPTVVQPTGSKQVNPPGAQPGAGGTQRLGFKALAKGTTTLDLLYDRPFAQGSPGAKDVTFTVTVS